MLGALAASWLLAGCAGLQLDEGRVKSRQLVESRLPTGGAVQGTLEQWLAKPLDLDTAVRVALLRNPSLAAIEAELGFGAADVFEAGRLHNPALGAAWLFPQGSLSGTKLSASITLDFTSLLLRRSTKRIADSAFEQLQAKVAASVLSLVSETQRAWVDAVAAAQRLTVRQSIQDVADAAAELAVRHAQAGNLSQLDLTVQQAAASEARLETQQAEAEFVDARAALQTLLGLDAGMAWTLPNSLDKPDTLPALELEVLREKAAGERLDLLAAQREVTVRVDELAQLRRNRLLGRSELGASLEREADGSRRLGPSVSMELPLFEQGQGRVARAEARLRQAQGSLRVVELAIDVELQQQLQKLRLARDRVEGYRVSLIPQREAVVARLQERVNFMLDDAFTLLLARQQEYAAYEGYVRAVQDYWRARVDLLRATGSQLVVALPGVLP
ncbi:MAG: hypothetical protein RLZZ200_1297 [Pseudomonadota bacterium]